MGNTIWLCWGQMMIKKIYLVFITCTSLYNPTEIVFYFMFVAEFNFILIFQFLYKPRLEMPPPRVVLRWSLPPSAVPVGRPAIRCTSRASGPGRPTQRDSPLMMVSFNYLVLEDLTQGKPFYMHWQYRSQFLSPSRPTLKDTPLMIVGIGVLGR